MLNDYMFARPLSTEILCNSYLYVENVLCAARLKQRQRLHITIAYFSILLLHAVSAILR